jgi:hypothetical protein
MHLSQTTHSLRRLYVQIGVDVSCSTWRQTHAEVGLARAVGLNVDDVRKYRDQGIGSAGSWRGDGPGLGAYGLVDRGDLCWVGVRCVSGLVKG